MSPDDGAAWLAVLGQETGAEEEALAAMARATRWHSSTGQLAVLVDEAYPADQPETGRLQVGLWAAMMDATFPGEGHSRFIRACAGDRLADANRRQVCDAVAGRMVRLAGNELNLRFGAAAGRRLGWEAGRLKAIKDEADAITGLRMKRLLNDSNPAVVCVDGPSIRTMHREIAAEGERAWAAARR